jgi:hypothetical protein
VAFDELPGQPPAAGLGHLGHLGQSLSCGGGPGVLSEERAGQGLLGAQAGQRLPSPGDRVHQSAAEHVAGRREVSQGAVHISHEIDGQQRQRRTQPTYSPGRRRGVPPERG